MPIAVPKGKAPFAKRQVKRLNDFSGGKNDGFSPALLKDNEVADVQNFTYDEKGTLTKRTGYTARYATPIGSGPVKGLYNYRKEDGTSLLVIACDGELFSDKPNFTQTYDSQSEWETAGIFRDRVTTTEDAGSVRPLAGTISSPGLMEMGGPGAVMGGSPVIHEAIWRSNTLDISAVADKTTGRIVKSATLPAGSSATFETRVSDDEVTWDAWTALGAGDTIQGVGSKTRLQVRVRLNSTSGRLPSVQSVIVSFDTTASATSIASGLSTTARYRFATQNDTLLVFNGENAPQKWDGVASTTSALGGSPPQGKYVILHKNRLFVAGVSSARSRLYYSDLGDPESWPALNFIDVGKGDGDAITGLSIVLDSLVITKDNSVWVLNGDSGSTFVLRRATDEGGSVGMYSFGVIKNTLSWLGKDGVRIFDGLRSALASEKIPQTLSALNARQLALSAGIVHDKKYYLAVPEGVSLRNDAVLVFDTLRTAWTVFRGMGASEWVVFRQFNEDTLLFGSSVTGQVYEMDDTYNDDGVAITAYVITKALAPAGGTEAQALMRNVYLSALEPQARATTATVSFFKDLGDETAGSVVSLAPVHLNVERTIPSALGVSLVRTIAAKVVHNEIDRGFNIHALTFEYSPRPGLKATF